MVTVCYGFALLTAFDIISQEVILAETDGFNPDDKKRKIVSTSLETTDNLWQMAVSYESESAGIIGASIAAVIVSAVVAGLVFVVLNQRRVHTNAMKEESLKRLVDAKEK